MVKIVALIISLLISIPCFAASQFDFLFSQVRTSSQGALVGGKIYFYYPATSTLKTVWLDNNESTIANNPYTLDANGTAQLYGSGTYRIVIKDSGGVIRFDRGFVAVAGVDGSINAIDATAADQTFILPTGGICLVCKTDNTAHTVTIVPSILTHQMGYDPLSVQGECIRLGLYGDVWYRE